LDLACVTLEAWRFAGQGVSAGVGASVHVDPRIGGIVEDGQDAPAGEGLPSQFTVTNAAPGAGGKEEMLCGEVLDDRECRAGVIKPVQGESDRLLDLLIGVEDDLTGGVINETGRWTKAELTFLGFFQLAAHEATAEPVEFRLAHGSFEAQEEPVIVLTGIVDPFFVHHQRVGQGTNLDEAIPITARAGEARRFQAEDSAGTSQTDLRDEELKAVSTDGGSPGMALILIDDRDMLTGPSQIERALYQVILARGAAGMVTDLDEGGLADIDEGLPLEMLRPDFVRGGWA
jgi:hypothetical protein